MDGGDQKPPQGLEAALLVTQLGVVIAAPIVLGVWLGVSLDRRFGTGGVLLFVGLLLGIGAGGLGAYRIVKPFLN